MEVALEPISGFVNGANLLLGASDKVAPSVLCMVMVSFLAGWRQGCAGDNAGKQADCGGGEDGGGTGKAEAGCCAQPTQSLQRG